MLKPEIMKPSPGAMWGTAFLMVTIVSCCSLIGVSIMPLISGPFYKSSITLFTGLAVGSLLGSAIFSLVPQAFGLHLQADKAYLWKSLVIFFGIYLFYCSERLMRIYFERRSRKKVQQQEELQLKKNDKHSANDNHDINIKRKNKNDDDGSGGDVPKTSSNDYNKGKEPPLTEINLAHGSADMIDSVESSAAAMQSIHNQDHSNDLQQHHHHHHHHHHSLALKPYEVITKALKSGSSTTLPRRAEIAPLAWMIIIGDGLHNFIDGLSIGAAFSESIYRGMIICVAVICEEFPHELGDFAVLISSGMTVRQALGFNFLSACTCYLGMIVGILLGDLAQSASFIFALAAGMFFYISLVDMMGELNATIEESPQEASHLLLMQNIGILSGIIIIFSLSLLGPDEMKDNNEVLSAGAKQIANLL